MNYLLSAVDIALVNLLLSAVDRALMTYLLSAVDRALNYLLSALDRVYLLSPIGIDELPATSSS